MTAEAAAIASRVGRETVGRAVDSLLKWLRAQTAVRKPQLLEHDEPLRLVLSLRKIPGKGRTNPYLISLPHPLHPLSGPGAAEVCLIADDRPSAPATPAAAEERIRDEGIPVSEVITLSGLRADYKAYEARRKLCGSYDIFVADRRILPLLPRLIGNQFFKKKKQPLPVDLSRKGWPEQLRRCLASATLYIRTGTCCQLDVGRGSQGREEIIDNVIAAIEGSLPYIPFDESVALPIYRALPEMGFKIETYQKPLVKGAGEEDFAKKDGMKKKKKKRESETKEMGGEQGRRWKGSIHQVRYMDTNLSDAELVSEQVNDDGDITREADEESDGEKKVSKKRKKEARIGKPEEVPDVDGVKKRKNKDRKSDEGLQSDLEKDAEVNGGKKRTTKGKKLDVDSTKAKTKLKRKVRQNL
ncbi:unnamed protein product [Spirodela intermedia]|uniref:Uncharacterized protein n=1 Tax=Spirodela intermedia TaxID=51605 RepID=A0A7I8IVZ3_SPIIN|nr:unnamed protein product [Spirodela intermedia]CAA6661319.1 unnamed protein product [Spirodela intermedia]